MALQLVLTHDTPDYEKGTILRDPVKVDAFRTSDYRLYAVQVTDEAIPPPAPPPPAPDLSVLQAAVQDVRLTNQAQDQTIAAALSADAQLDSRLSQASSTIAQQTQTIQTLNSTVETQNALIQQQNSMLAALGTRVSALEAGTPPPDPDPDPDPGPDPVDPNLADDRPLGDASGDVPVTNSGKALYGDLRLP